MTKIEVKLPKKLEDHLDYLAIVSKRPKEFIVREALIRYLEDAEDIAKVFEREKKKGDKTYTTEELLQHLNLKEVSV
ncbi:ribbon-helix-helix protein, CopG family [endosymbiont GvMRE of Glomus versiforme]|uniref:ribbon-helix-helix protein, CopG family n=1 Tax=endosymbiont GvMRE of Glomus versiforme TaxID=2039283 RepID=UPI0011C359E6|nr:ribbon-helix-helix protein, CopG family [endosymbiont GvMRE of Glomus versiforme]